MQRYAIVGSGSFYNVRVAPGRYLAFAALALVTGCGAILGIHDPEIVATEEAGVTPDVDPPPPDDGGGVTPGGPSTMVTVPRPDAGGQTFQIDVTEVTQAQYADFLARGTDGILQLPQCNTNASFRPAAGFTPDLTPNHPVSGVDWCDAYAYCQYVGKRLCGNAASGVPGAFADNAAVARSEWLAACTKGGENAYPYGAQERPNACNTTAADDAGAILDVGAKRFCEGGYTGVMDLVGNVAEWVDLCDQSQCATMGGSYSFPTNAVVSCRTVAGHGRLEAFADIGFRCCR